MVPRHTQEQVEQHAKYRPVTALTCEARAALLKADYCMRGTSWGGWDNAELALKEAGDAIARAMDAGRKLPH